MARCIFTKMAEITMSTNTNSIQKLFRLLLRFFSSLNDIFFSVIFYKSLVNINYWQVTFFGSCINSHNHEIFNSNQPITPCFFDMKTVQRRLLFLIPRCPKPITFI